MSVVPMRKGLGERRATAKRKAQRVYAIAFDLDCEAAQRLCGAGWRGCYEKIAGVFSEYGFTRQQGSLYFGTEESDAVQCVMAVQEADARYAWFARVVRDLRMLRVDEDNDLLPAINRRLRLGRDDQVA